MRGSSPRPTPTWRSPDGTIELYHSSAESILPQLARGACHGLITDPPYGTTAAEWDTGLPASFWDHAYRVTRRGSAARGGAVVMFCCGHFTFDLIAARRRELKYKLVWHRQGRATGFLDANRRPLRQHEDILIFSQGKMPNYWPAKIPAPRLRIVKTSARGSELYSAHGTAGVYDRAWRHLRDVISIAPDASSKRIHTTQKPVELMRLLVRCYSPRGGVVLDPFIGSGSMVMACLAEGRRCIGIERDRGFFKAAVKRIEAAIADGSFRAK